MIVLHALNGKELYLNPSKVVAVIPNHSTGAFVLLEHSDSLEVKESAHDVNCIVEGG